MKPQLRSGVSPWVLLVFFALLRNSHAECEGPCDNNTKLNTTNTAVAFEPTPNCTISTGDNVSVNGSLTGLSPGAVYEIFFNCLNCCVNVTLEPGVVRNLTVTNVSTSSVSVNWTKPIGNSSFYTVQWAGGNVNSTKNVSETSTDIVNLTAGVQYEISVTAVADDGQTYGQSSAVIQYTRPGIIGNHNIVSQSTSSISLNWTPPPGEVFMYRLEWQNGGSLMTRYINGTSAVLSELIPGTIYTVTITAVAGDNEAEGDPQTFTSVTRPEAVRNLTVTNVRTSSVSVNWTKPIGNSSFYTVQWAGGNVNSTKNVSETSTDIVNLTAGVQYEISVTAVADDGQTYGQSSAVIQYTRPGIIGNHNIVSQSTSSISLNWTPPPGEVFMYRLEWQNGGSLMTRYINGTSAVLSELIPGTIYTVTITAVAGDNEAEGDPQTFTSVTRPEAVRNLTVTNVSTSSVSVNWTKPIGNSSFYTVQWAGGNVNSTKNVSETSTDIVNLTAGVQYEISVTAVADDGQTYGQSSAVIQYTRPGIIGNHNIVSQSTSSISLNWTPPPGEVFMYRLEWQNGGSLMTRYINGTSAVLSELIPGTIYTVTITAVAGDNEAEGDPQTFTSVTRPEAVRNLTVTNVSTSSVSVNWTKPIGNSSFYTVQWAGGNVNSTKNVSETSTDIVNLTAGVQYEISVTAVADDGQTYGQSSAVIQYTRPGIIGNHNIVSQSTSSISLNWTPPPGEVFMYRLEWHNGGALMTRYINGTSAVLSELIPGTIYTVTITAVAGDNEAEGDPQTFTSVTRPEAVRNLTVTNVSTSSVSVNWTKPIGNSSFYTVQWAGGNVNSTKNVSETSADIVNLTAGVQYEISVTAVADDGQTYGQSSAVIQYTKPEVVLNLSVSNITTSSVYVMWTEPRGEHSFYRVQWTNGTADWRTSVNETKINITELTAGVKYTFTVIAVAGDSQTESERAQISHYTRPGIIGNHNIVSQSTSSISLNWTPPPGEVFMYRLEWHNGGALMIRYINGTSAVLSELIPGTIYTVTITAVAGDNETEGDPQTFTSVTRPGVVRNLTLTTVTTSSVSVNWTKPAGNSSFYTVQLTSDGLLHATTNTSDTSAVLSELISGTTYTITVTAVAGDSKTKGDPKDLTAVTKPRVIRNLTVTNVTTSSVSVNWTKPGGHSSFYIVQWTNGTVISSKNVSETSTDIVNLTAGFKYAINVTAVADDNDTVGQSVSVSQHTRPTKPTNITAQGTLNLSISWVLPEGQVEQYLVDVSNTMLKPLHANTTATTIHFTDLKPGRIYNITVAASAGDFTNTSDLASLATNPTPPGSPSISERTNSSLQLNWATPFLMEDALGISYNIIYQSMFGEVQINREGNTAELTSLSSGILYNITMVTVGPNNLKSTAVFNSSYTLPNPVLNLTASPQSTTSIKVEWLYPHGAQPYYRYLIKAISATGKPVTKQVDNNSTDLTDLEPGSRYNISVSTTIAEESRIVSTEEETFSYTMPKAVTNLKVSEVNKTAIQLTWLNQSDYKPSYSYLVIALQDGIEVQKNETKTETYTFFHLTPGKLYTFLVFTVVGGVKSEGENTSSFTRPEAVSDITVTGNTTAISVSWMPAFGGVLSYNVLLYRGEKLLLSNKMDLPNTTEDVVFVDLEPGVYYCVRVSTKSGSFVTDSPKVCNATFPTPPGPITVESQTEQSINFTWPLPDVMNHTNYTFSVSYVNGLSLTANNWFLLDKLESGSPYNITVVTVGVNDYQSTPVTAQNYTRPYAVINLALTEITTNAVTLVWEQRQSKPYYTYEVQVTNGSYSNYQVVENTTNTVNGLSSGSNYSFTVTTQTADGTQAYPVTVSYFTRPFGIRSLEAETLDTTTVSLTWMQPLEYKNEYTYQVETPGCVSQNKSVEKNDAQISGLIPGTNCTFCVSVRAENGIKGEALCISQYTKPEAVHPSISSQGSNNSILVSWIKPRGNLEYYKVYLNRTSSPDTCKELNTTTTFFLFDGLSAGMLYTAMVVTFSGPFNATSGPITNATFPNPPGSIEFLTKTTNSITIRWDEAPLMSNASFLYKLISTQSQGSGNITTTNNTVHTFAPLLSGTSYNISITTVGPKGFESEAVYIYLVTTKPLSVKSLVVRKTEENNMAVAWERATDYKEGYRYVVTWQGQNGPNSITTDMTEYTIYNLEPGTNYSFEVTTMTSDGTKSAPTSNFSCTKASPVKDLQCDSPDEPNAQINLFWSKPRGLHSGFLVRVNDNEIITTNTCCNQTVSNLQHFTYYNLTVETQSCGLPSIPVPLSCLTGITVPPIPLNYESMVVVTERVYDKFSLQIDITLLDGTSGPITHVGVLVTNNPPGDNLTMFLEKTYYQWKAKETEVYLATIEEVNVQPRSGEDVVNIIVGDKTTSGGYTNGPLDATGKYQYAMVLFTRLEKEHGLVNVQKSLFSITKLYITVELPQNPAVIGLAIGVTLGIFCILFIILIGFIIYWKRLSNKESSDIQIHSMRAKVSVAVRMEDYEDYYKKQKADSNCGFAEEFEDLKLVGTGQSKTSALTLENKPKNRYNNVLPYDSSRVKLSIIHGSPYDDYINANYMPGYNSRKEFIAAQGPLPTTVNEFWRMIWEKNVQTLVMLTRCNEQGRVKCEQYWSSDTKHFDNITVTTTSEIPLEDWTIRDFDVKNVKTAETRAVRHFHFTAWPDHGVPETTELLISFRHLVREHMDQYSRHSPTVVHCSAGVGRTGTFISIDRLIFQIERENIVDVYGIVHDLRMHRPLMVQTEDQYVFLNQCAMDIIRARTGTNVDLIYQNTAALSIYENVEPKKGFRKNGYDNA